MWCGAVLTDMSKADHFDHEYEALFAHLAADHWRLEALSRQRDVKPQHLYGVRSATLERLATWRRIVRQYDLPAPVCLVAQRRDTALAEREAQLAEYQASQAMREQALAVLEDEARMRIQCPYCASPPGQWCVRPASGQPSPTAHAARTGALAATLIPCPHCRTPLGAVCDDVSMTTHKVRREQAAMVLLADREQTVTT